MPFDHIVVVMMENHSFDNLLGELHRTREDVEGLNFNADGEATNSNPTVKGGPSDVTAYRLKDTSQAKNITQSWKATHEQINGGAMNGFVISEKGASFFLRHGLQHGRRFCRSHTHSRTPTRLPTNGSAPRPARPTETAAF